MQNGNSEEKERMVPLEERNTVTKNGTIDIPTVVHVPDDDRPPDRSWLQRQFIHLYGILGVMALLIVAILVLSIILFIGLKNNEQKYVDVLSKLDGLVGSNTSKGSKDTPEVEWIDGECPSMAKCSHLKSTPPLLILSFDGFAHSYLEKNIMKTFARFKECGATAERVIPSYPSKTFPNHYTIATGLYPESHGIVDNNIFDLNISSNVEDLKRTKADKLWGGDPIWNAYTRITGKKAACLFWPGCGFEIAGKRPSISPAYDKSLLFTHRFDMVQQWLTEGVELVMAYFDEPDTVGHHQMSEKDIEEGLAKIDFHLNIFLNNLKKAGLLDCLNIVIVSDHGMQLINKVIKFKDHLDLEGVATTDGVIGRLFKNGTKASTSELQDPFTCNKVPGVRTFTRESIPSRKHHSRDERVGDVILQGDLGVAITDGRKYTRLTADHGYDYIHDVMHTIFFARGPSFKPNSHLKAFQNVEYMNLWLNLLKLDYIPNNGTQGVLDGILVEPVGAKKTEVKQLGECSVLNENFNFSCCSGEDTTNFENLLTNCPIKKSQFFNFTSSKHDCLEDYCSYQRLRVNDGENFVIMEELNKENIEKDDSCLFSVNKYQNNDCDEVRAISHWLPRSGKDSTIGNNTSLTEQFVNSILSPLNNYTKKLVQQSGTVWTISGITSDANRDGLSDEINKSQPTHYYRIHFLSTKSQTQFISFIFPLSLSNDNCLKPDDLLMEYTARLKDVELISGLTWTPHSMKYEDILHLRTFINLKLL